MEILSSDGNYSEEYGWLSDVFVCEQRAWALTCSGASWRNFLMITDNSLGLFSQTLTHNQ